MLRIQYASKATGKLKVQQAYEQYRAAMLTGKGNLPDCSNGHTEVVKALLSNNTPRLNSKAGAASIPQRTDQRQLCQPECQHLLQSLTQQHLRPHQKPVGLLMLPVLQPAGRLASLSARVAGSWQK